MHPDLPKLLDVQGKDRHLSEVTARREELAAERQALDAAAETARQQVAQAERIAADTATRRDEREKKLEAQRAMQEKRRARLDQERSPRVAAQLMADVEMARAILAQEESEWMRLAEEATARQAAVASLEARFEALGAEQADARATLADREATVAAEQAAAQAERDTAAAGLDRALRVRYDRLHSSRRSEVLVPAVNATCTACYTAIPRSRIGRLQADGLLLEGCEMCGAILYLEEVPA
jgi:predicted  nucleic acid-binding Zn-ribbon protein